MTTTTLQPTRPVVKLSGPDLVAGISGDRLHVQYQATLQTSLNLDDAIKTATVVLDYARRNGIDIGEAAADIEMLPPDWDWEEAGGYQLKF